MSSERGRPQEPALEALSAEKTAKPREGVTLRSVGIGLLIVVFVNFWIPYSLFLIQSSWLQVTHFPMGLFVPFMLLALLVNPILKAVRKGLGLSRSEVLVVAAMGLPAAVDGAPTCIARCGGAAGTAPGRLIRRPRGAILGAMAPSDHRSRLTAVLGPTNTGKTHLAIERMLGHATGMIGFPLRLLVPGWYGMTSIKWIGVRTQRSGSLMPLGQWAIIGLHWPPS